MKLNFQNDKEGDRRRKPDQATEVERSSKPRKKPRRGEQPEVGSALRSAYQRTIDEAIPPAMLDLLGKLG